MQVQAVRLLIEVQPPGDVEEIARPDATNNGFRVARKVNCVLEPSDPNKYVLNIAVCEPLNIGHALAQS